MAPVMLDITWDATLQNVLVGSLILGLISGVLGCFAVLRRQSLIGDALAHAALPGICLMFMATATRSSEWLLTGGLITGLLGTLIVIGISRWSIVKPETALGIVLSVFFGWGILLLTRIQHSEGAGQSGLDRFIFGQAATILPRDVRVMALLAGISLLLVILLYKELKLVTFDPEFAASIGISPSIMGLVIAGLLVVAVMIGLQTVGVILMVSLLIAPAVAARQWTTNLSTMIIVAGGIGMASGALGSFTSSVIDRLPTGPMIVVVASAFVLVSLLFAPGRGIIWNERDRRRRFLSLRRHIAKIEHHQGLLP